MYPAVTTAFHPADMCPAVTTASHPADMRAAVTTAFHPADMCAAVTTAFYTNTWQHNLRSHLGSSTFVFNAYSGDNSVVLVRMAKVELFIANVEVVQRILSAIDGDVAFAAASDQQANFLVKLLDPIKSIDLVTKTTATAALEGLRMEAASKDRVLLALNGKWASDSKKRPQQDFSAWPSFLTMALWNNIHDNAHLSSELILQHLHSLGLICPLETTIAQITSGIVVATRGPIMANALSYGEVKEVYESTKKRIKQLYRSEPLEYITQLPATPALLLQQYPTTATHVFSRDRLPTSCPLNAAAMSQVLSKIDCRDKPKKAGTKDIAVSNSNTMQTMLQMAVQFLGQRQPPSSPSSSSPHLTFPPAFGRLEQPSRGSMALEHLKLKVANPASSEQLVFSPPRSDPTHSPKISSAADSDEAQESAAEVAAAAAEAAATPVKDQNKSDEMRAKILLHQGGLVTDRKALAAAKKKALADRKALAAAKKKSIAKKPAGTAVMKKPAACKPRLWLLARPDGCAKCRWVKGCTASCYIGRGEKVPS